MTSFKDIGLTFKQEREKQGLSLDDVNARIKISKSSLQLIEEGNVDELPHPVYAKGFVKNYARFLGLDENQFAQAFDEYVRDREHAEENDIRERKYNADYQDGDGIRNISIILTFVLVLILGWLIYDIFIQETKVADTDTRQVAELNQTADQSPRPEAVLEQDTETESKKGLKSVNLKQKEQNQPVEKETTAAPKAMAGNFSSSRDTVMPQTENNTENLPVISQENVNSSLNEIYANSSVPMAEKPPERDITEQVQDRPENHSLRISAEEECWLRAVVDDRVKEVYLRPGDYIVLRFMDQLQVKLGNAGGVNLIYDGRKFPIQAESGEVKNFTFPQ